MHCVFTIPLWSEGNEGINWKERKLRGHNSKDKINCNRKSEAGPGTAEPSKLPLQSGTGNISSDRYLKGSVPRGITQYGKQKRHRLRATSFFSYFCIVVTKRTREEIAYFGSWLLRVWLRPIVPMCLGRAWWQWQPVPEAVPHFLVDRSRERQILVIISLSSFSPFILCTSPAHEIWCHPPSCWVFLLSVLSRNRGTDISEEASLMP